MKTLLTTTMLALLLTAPAFAMPVGAPIVSAGDTLNACMDRLRGQPVDFASAHQKRWKGGSRDFTCWNDPQACGQPGLGSQNEPVLAACAVGDYGWIAALAVKEKQDGFFGREIGSPGFYFHSVVAAKMAALHMARQASDTLAVDRLMQNLRAIWTYEALLAVDTPRVSGRADLSGVVQFVGGDTGSYDGLTVAVAGERWKSVDYLTHDVHGEFLSWAIDWPRARMPGNKNTVQDGRWWDDIVGFVAHQTDYRTTPNPLYFGLNLHQRDVLNDVVAGNLSAVAEAIQWLRPGNLNYRYDTRIRRTTLGTEVIFYKATNGNKPPHGATSITNAGYWSTIRAGKGAKGGALGHRIEIVNGTIYNYTTDPDGNTASMPELGGSVIYEIWMTGGDSVQTVP